MQFKGEQIISQYKCMTPIVYGFNRRKEMKSTYELTDTSKQDDIGEYVEL